MGQEEKPQKPTKTKKEGRNADGTFEEGNELWMFVKDPGRNHAFETPQKLWEDAVRYFKWCEAHPVLGYGPAKDSPRTKHVRAFTFEGLCLYLNVSDSYFRNFRHIDQEQDTAFLTVIAAIDKAIYNQKFSAAAADLLNARIISRDLGLRDAHDHTSNGNTISTAAPIINVVAPGTMPPIAENESEIADKEPATKQKK